MKPRIAFRNLKSPSFFFEKNSIIVNTTGSFFLDHDVSPPSWFKEKDIPEEILLWNENGKMLVSESFWNDFLEYCNERRYRKVYLLGNDENESILKEIEKRIK